MASQQRVSVSAPASSANLGPGFDVFALALDVFWDVIKLEKIDKGLEVIISSNSKEPVPQDAQSNACGVVALEMIREFGIVTGVRIEVEKGVPVGVGLGSSGASAAATTLGLDRMFQIGLSDSELVRWAAKGERVSAGAEHRDNVAASLFGGFVLVKPDSLEVLKLQPPKNMGVVICMPDLPKMDRKTEKLRAVLPKAVPLKDVVANVGNASAMVYAIAHSDIELIGKAMKDVIVEPARMSFVPGYLKVRDAALEHGAAGAALSGAGPSVLALYDKSEAEGDRIGRSMVSAFASVGVAANFFLCKPAPGAHLRA